MGWLTKVFGRPETRSSYTDLALTAAWQSAAGASLVGDVRHTAAMETVCRLYAAVFAVAEVKGPPWLRRALSGTWRASVVRAMLRDGEHLDVIESAPGGVELVPAAAWTVLGRAAAVVVELSRHPRGPSGTLTRQVEGDSVIPPALAD